MPTIVDTWVDAVGDPVSDAVVEARLRTSSTSPDAVGFDASNLVEVIPTAAGMTDALGAFTLDLIPNDNFDGTTPGSYYEVTVTAGARTYGPVYIVVPSAGGPYKLQDVLTATAPLLVDDPPQHFVPRLFVSDGTGALTEVNYGTSPAARDCKFEATPLKVRATYMIRMDTAGGASMGTSGRYFALELPVPAALDIGNSLAIKIGDALFGLTTSPVHKPASVHTGVVNDGLNPNYCYFVADGTIAVANNSFSLTPSQWADFHVQIEYWR